MKNFKVIEAEMKGDLKVRSNTQFNNVNADHVTLFEDVSARVYGNIKHSITLKKGAKLYLHGKSQGTIQNDGGEIFIY
jgi:hypothetical protein